MTNNAHYTVAQTPLRHAFSIEIMHRIKTNPNRPSILSRQRLIVKQITDLTPPNWDDNG